MISRPARLPWRKNDDLKMSVEKIYFEKFLPEISSSTKLQKKQQVKSTFQTTRSNKLFSLHVGMNFESFETTIACLEIIFVNNSDKNNNNIKIKCRKKTLNCFQTFIIIFFIWTKKIKHRHRNAQLRTVFLCSKQIPRVLFFCSMLESHSCQKSSEVDENPF